MPNLNTDRYRRMLLEERARICEELDAVERDIGRDDDSSTQSELADYDQHPADAASDTFVQERDLAIRDSFRDVIGRIDEAVGKIERGTYGSCDRCGAEIPKARLDALPHAIYCVECQDLVEAS